LSESNNLAEEKPEKAKQLQAKLHHWLKEVDAQIPVRNLNRKK